MIPSKVLVAFALRKVNTDHQKSICLDYVTFLSGHFVASFYDFRAMKRSMYKLIEYIETAKVFLRCTLNLVSFIYLFLSISHHHILKNDYGHSLLP